MEVPFHQPEYSLHTAYEESLPSSAISDIRQILTWDKALTYPTVLYRGSDFRGYGRVSEKFSEIMLLTFPSPQAVHTHD